jgi:hypothetical protein
MDLKDLNKLIDNISTLDKDDVLEKLGLETRKNASDYLLPAIGLFGAGLAVGCGLGLLLAPKSGRELRAELGERLNEGLEQGRAQLERTAQQVADKVNAKVG